MYLKSLEILGYLKNVTHLHVLNVTITSKEAVHSHECDTNIKDRGSL